VPATVRSAPRGRRRRPARSLPTWWCASYDRPPPARRRQRLRSRPAPAAPGLAGACDAHLGIRTREQLEGRTRDVADDRGGCGDAPTVDPFHAGDLVGVLGAATAPYRGQIVICDGRKVTVGPQRRQTPQTRSRVACARCADHSDERSVIDPLGRRGAGTLLRPAVAVCAG